ncbi:MAG: SsrA-binding protein SmpB [Acidobacteriales bacterium]|nr:SsrA-binding protein SmpB [Terriglobales bacterium]
MPRPSSHAIQAHKPKNPKRDPVAAGERDASVNRSASHNYILNDRMEAGVVLRGTEVKSVRKGQANLKDAYALVKDNELWLLNAHIGAYEHGSYANHEPLRTRKLLASRTEINKLAARLRTKGLTLIPTRMYFKNGKVKIEIAMAKGKQEWDKRETERRRTDEREARDAIRARKARE